ncbi:MAG: glutamate racemase [Muribaculaceae bacterium]|nr:glutamate racemase [Muribaculaceae bacterium]
MSLHSVPGPIGIFDSGYGGLTILEGIRRLMPEPDYLYLGDNARAPYGTRSFEVVYQFTLQAVKRLFDEGCHLVILGCNTASAKALRTIQQNDLPEIDPSRRVLGIIRPTVEALGGLTRSGHIGVFGTPGTIRSRSYEMEVSKLYPDFQVTGQECPMWVPLVENREADSPGADYFVQKYVDMLLTADPKNNRLFNPKASLACTGNTGPFLQYTYARIRSICRRAEAELASCSYAEAVPNEKEQALIQKIADFP